MRVLHWTGAAMLGLAAMSISVADSGDTINDMAMYGFNRDTGHLLRYDFDAQAFLDVGQVKDKNGQLMAGIDAAAYYKGFQNIFAFWNNPADKLTYMVYVDTETAHGVVIGPDLGDGHVTGAVAAKVANGEGGTEWVLFAAEQVQRLNAKSGALAGKINLNPNNSHHSEFQLVLPDGMTFNGQGTITRDELHRDAQTHEGIYYEGPAASFLVKPKGQWFAEPPDHRR